MLKHNIIELSQSEWSSSVNLASNMIVTICLMEEDILNINDNYLFKCNTCN